MEDREIVALFWARKQEAVPAAAEKYGNCCAALARRILSSAEDSEECVNDTYLRAWEAIPPNRPEKLGAFLCKLTRNLAFSRWRREHAEKRGGGETALVLEELGEIVSGGEDAAAVLDRRELLRAIEDYLRGLDRKKREMFLRRCWYAQSVGEIARDYGMTAGAVTMALGRIRQGLREDLRERGFEL